MSYIIGLLIIISLIFTFGGKGDLLHSNIFDSVKAKISDTLFPMSAKEILINNLGSNLDQIESLLSPAVKDILKSKNVSQKDKTALQNAVKAVADSKKKLAEVKTLDKKDQSLLKTLSQKIIGNIIKTENTEPGEPQATYIPSQCKMVCLDD